MTILSFFDPITTHPLFNKVTGSMFLVNPIPIIPGLYGMYKAPELNDPWAIIMWITFAILQATTALVGAQTRNHGLFWSMIISMILSLIAVGLMVYK